MPTTSRWALWERARRSCWATFGWRFASERAGASRRPIAKLIERVLDQSAYRERVLELAAGRQRLANIHKLLRLAGRFEETEGRDLRGFLDYGTGAKRAQIGLSPTHRWTTSIPMPCA